MTHRTARITARIAAVAALLSLALSACGDDEGLTVSTTGPGSGSVEAGNAPTIPVTGGTSDGGWIEGEPEWDTPLGELDRGGDGDGAVAYDAPAEMASPAATEAPADTVTGGGDVDRPASESAAPLRAGSVDDNADFAGYLEYLERIDTLGVPVRSFDPSGRIVLTVTGANGLPVVVNS